MPTTKPSRVLLVSGSLRSGSTNSAMLRTAHAVAPPPIVTALYGELGALPHFNPDDDIAPLDPAVARLRAADDAHDSLRKVIGYANAKIIEEACAHIPVTSAMIDDDGLISDPTVHKSIAEVLITLAGVR